ncbi:MAG: hypothetical protein H7A37_00710 [Chlamydiales bacterium]|nr:hypothetical protein [Chlamydiia bacterium]MCP5506813.1 hypothetical protein [Chlamydiales bacterium]
MTTIRALLLTLILVTAGDLRASFFSGEVGLGYDFFRSLPEGTWEGNTGGLISFNVAADAPCFCNSDYGVQFGSSYGVYDWHGRESAPTDRQQPAQQQVFLTAGIFRTADCDCGINYGIVYDWMWDTRIGVFGAEASIDQLRFQGGYTYCCNNEFGFFGTLDLHRAHRTSQQIPLTFRAISQINAFWRHLFANCAETMVWIGIPYKSSLMFTTGRAGKFILGGSVRAPLTDRFMLEGHAAYMEPHSAAGAIQQRYYAANICIELKYAFGSGCCGKQPYMPLANNSNFFVDTNVTF